MATKFDYDKVKEIIEKENCKLISKDYINTKEKITIKCKCGNDFETSLFSFIHNNKTTCRECSNTRLRKNRTFDFEYVKTYINNTGLKYISGEYLNRRSELLILCKCGEEYISSFEKIKDRQYLNCRKCRNKKISSSQTKDHHIFVTEVFNILGEEFRVIGNYKKDGEKIRMKHLKCNTEYESTPSNILRGRGCPKCKTSHLEKTIERYLIENSIKYETQKTFEGLKNRKKLRMDFYLNDYNICIEADGRQHFESVDIFGGEKTFTETQKRDIIKDNFCRDNEIKMIRIPYYDLRNIYNIMDNIFKGNTVVS